MKRSVHARMYSRWTPYVFLLPWLFGLLAFTVIPLASSFFLGFTRYDLFTSPEFIGFRNYARLLEDSRHIQSLRVTFVYVLVGVPLQLFFALLLAYFLNTGVRGLPIYRALFYLPSLFGASVAVALVWRRLFGNQGVLTELMRIIGYTGPGWINSPDMANFSLIILRVWMFGSPMVIFLAALRQVPQDLYDSAAIDGAGPGRQFLRITLPMISPVILFNVIMQTISAFQSFTQAFVVSDGTGGPLDATLFYTLYLYQKAFSSFQMGYASAMAWILVSIIGGMTALAFASSNRWVHYES